MGRTHLAKLLAPISPYLLSKLLPTQDDIDTLKTIASLDPTKPCQIMGTSFTLVSTFNQAVDAQKQDCIIFARSYLGDLVTKLPHGPTLLMLAQFFNELIHKAHESEKARVANQIGLDALMRCAMVNPNMAATTFERLIAPLNLPRKKWLYFCLALNQMVKEFNLKGEIFKGPDLFDEDKSLIPKLITLYYHWPQLREQFKERIEQQLGATSIEVLSQTENQSMDILQEEVSKNFIPFINSFFPIKSANYLDVMEALSSFSAPEIAWLAVNVQSIVPLSVGDIGTPQTLINQLSKLLSRFGRQSLLLGLQEKNTSELNQKAQEAIEYQYDSAIKGLSYNARNWLFLSLLLEDNTDYFPFDVRTPPENELAYCKQLLALANECPNITRMLHQRLSARMPYGKETELFGCILRFIRENARSLNDQMRLWQFLSLYTHSSPQFFSMMPSKIHETQMGNVIYQTQYTTLSAQFSKMATYSDFVRNAINQSLLTNVNQSSHFEQSVAQLPLYQGHTFKSTLKSCDKNTLYWIYFTLTTNMPISQRMVIAQNFSITKPSDRAYLHAKQILDIAAHNKSATRAILKEIENITSVDETQKIKSVINHFLQAKLSKISNDAKKWLYLALKTLTVENIFQRHPPVTLPLPEKTDLAKIVYLLENNIELIEVAKAHLIEKLPLLAQITPEDDNYHFFAYSQCDQSEFCYYQSLSEEKSLALLPLLLKSTAKATKAWLNEALTSGRIDSRLLIQALPQDMTAQVAHELSLLPNILILALQWPSVRAKIIQECGGSPLQMPPVSQLIVDKLPFYEKGMIALGLALSSHCDKLTHFSAVDTGLTDDSLLVLCDTLIGKAPLKVLQVHHNPLLTSHSLTALLQTANQRLTPAQQNYMITTLVSCLNDPYVLAWLSLKLKGLQDNALEAYIRNNNLFYTTNASQDKFYLANALYEDCRTSPHKAATLADLTTFIVRPVFENNQLVHSAIQSQSAEFIFKTMRHSVMQLATNRVKNWLRSTLMTGKISLSTSHYATDEEMMLMQQLACMLLVSSKSQRFALGQLLGLSVQDAIPEISSLSFHKISLNPCLKKCLIQALAVNTSVSRLTLNGLLQEDETIGRLCDALQNNLNLTKLDLSANPITRQGAGYIGNLLMQNPAIEALTLNDTLGGEEVLIEIAQCLPRTHLEKLTAQQTGCSLQTPPLREKAAQALAHALSEGCALKHLDLSCNEIDGLGAQYLFHSLTSERCHLKTLKLNYNNLGDMALTRLCHMLSKPNTLTSIELNGHHAKPTQLASVAQNLKDNHNIAHFEAMPTYLLDARHDNLPENAKEANHILATIKQTVENNAAQKHLMKKLKQLSLADNESAENEPLRRCSSLPTFESQDHNILRFSGQNIPRAKPNPTSSCTTLHNKFAFVKH